MIPKEVVEKIFDTARIEEVVGDYVSLKKRGSNLIGLCPFHNEKSPSFNVNPARGIYKCFGCGKGGNSVNFIMEHDHLSYPEALKQIANKYKIEVPEVEQTSEEVEKANEKESIYVVLAFAQKHYSENLFATEEGKAIGLSYFKERGFTEETVQKFQLGYSPDTWKNLTDAALKAGYKLEYLVKAGLTIQNEEDKEKYFDRFKGRIIFPIHNPSGRVLGFGGRVMKVDKKTAKYINSPETEVYHKSTVLYGLYFAKKEIALYDECYLVEGYTDVTSMHQAGIENVVASSGTALTVEQIRLIRRYTNNITILYDGDAAGIKASFRGIDLILSEGMNVRVLLFPDGDDPDSYSKKVGREELKQFIKENTRDFIRFKTELLSNDVKNDPIKKVGMIHEIVNSIALIPDAITRSVFTKDCAVVLHMEEKVLIEELNKSLHKINPAYKKTETQRQANEITETEIKLTQEMSTQQQDGTEFQEREIIRLLLNYGDKLIPCKGKDYDGNETTFDATLTEFLLNELDQDNMEFKHETYQQILYEYKRLNSENKVPDVNYFTNHQQKSISELSADLLSNPFQLSDWGRHSIQITTEDMELEKAVLHATYSFKLRHIETLIALNRKKIRESEDKKDDESIIVHLTELKGLQDGKKWFSDKLGRVVIR